MSFAVFVCVFGRDNNNDDNQGHQICWFATGNGYIVKALHHTDDEKVGVGDLLELLEKVEG